MERSEGGDRKNQDEAHQKKQHERHVPCNRDHSHERSYGVETEASRPPKQLL